MVVVTAVEGLVVVVTASGVSGGIGCRGDGCGLTYT